MFIQSLKYDYQTGGILVEYVTKGEAREMSAKLSKAIFGKGELEQFDGLVTGINTVENYLMVGTDAGADEIDQIIEFIKDKADPDQYDENDYEQKGTNESYYDDEPSPFETYEAYVASDMEDILNERGIRGRGHNKYLDTLDKDLQIRKELRRFFDEDVDEEEAAERLINLIDQINEDFSMGVEGPTGLNQGIPHGGPGKGVIPAPLFGKGKPMSREEQKEDKKKLKKALDALDLYGVKVKKVTEAMPEYFCRNPWTVEDVDHYLYHDLGFESGEVDDLIALNLDLINDLLEKGKSPEEVADALDYSTVQDAED
jgi:hypothetical protein